MRGPNKDIAPLSWLPLVTFCCRIFSLICYSHSSQYGCRLCAYKTVASHNMGRYNNHTSLLCTLFLFTFTAIFVKDTLVHFWSDLQQYLCKMLLQSSHSSQNSYWTPPATTLLQEGWLLLLEDGWSASDICGSRFILSMGHSSLLQDVWSESNICGSRFILTCMGGLHTPQLKASYTPAMQLNVNIDIQYLCKAGVLFPLLSTGCF